MVPLLPFPLNLMNKKECVKYIQQILCLDYEEKHGKTVLKVVYGDPAFKPIWWSDLIPWENLVGSIFNFDPVYNGPHDLTWVYRQIIAKALQLKNIK